MAPAIMWGLFIVVLLRYWSLGPGSVFVNPNFTFPDPWEELKHAETLLRQVKKQE
ncbi:hypothetical protein QFZ77_006254 [Paenibacillus sp. V4I3]|nr:hypothetical protein [Paenibacillus sp. V4I3]